MWKKKLQLAGWCTLGFAVIAILVMAMRDKNDKLCKKIQVEISNSALKGFVEEKEVLKQLQNNGAKQGDKINSIPLLKFEPILKKNVWIRQVELFFDNNQVMHVKIEVREPLARVFTKKGNSFYIDSEGIKLPLSKNISTRLPVFTSFPSNNNILSSTDTGLLQDVKKIALHIRKDSFLTALVSQVEILPNHTYELIPVVGRHIIQLGDATDLDKKFERLNVFYTQILTKTGFEKYTEIDVRYQGQVVAASRSAGTETIDTNANNTLRQNNASVHHTVMTSMEKVPNTMKKQISSAKKTTVVKQTVSTKRTISPNKNNKPSATSKPKPKAVMKKQ